MARRLLVPEVVQTSQMDCGPAALKAVFEGFGISLSYGRLREACQTSVSGTTIDRLEEIAQLLGLDAVQTMMPIDHLVLDEARALPAIVIVRLPSGANHFVVVWKRHGPFLQIMDPGAGRRWVRAQTFLRDVYNHAHFLPREVWSEFAHSTRFLDCLRRRCQAVGITGSAGAALLDEAKAAPGWYPLAAFDASLRLVESVHEAGAIRPGREAAATLRVTYERALAAGPSNAGAALPTDYWFVEEYREHDGGREISGVRIRGGVLLQVNELIARPREGASADDTDSPVTARGAELPPELAAALHEKPDAPLAQVMRIAGREPRLVLGVVAAGTALGAVTALVQALLFRSLFDVSRHLAPGSQRMGAAGVFLALIVLAIGLDAALALALARVGRQLEARLRMAFLRKLPRLPDRYFRSRLTSDMAERGHTLQSIRTLPSLATRFVGAASSLVCTTAGVCWLDPSVAPLALALAAVGVILPFLFQPLVFERDLRLRTYQGAVTRFYLDAMLGIIPIRAHAAERVIRREHEGLLVDLVGAGLRMQRISVVIDGIGASLGLGLSALILHRHLARAEGTAAASALLLTYWALQLPALGRQLAQTLRQYPVIRNITLRVFEPLGAPEEEQPAPGPSALARRAGGVAIDIVDVDVEASGLRLLEGITASIPAGAHVAIVGHSGAGKSTLLGALLGWMKPSKGTIFVDGEPLAGARLADLRAVTAWVDPTVQLWNRSIFDNVAFGAPDDGNGAFAGAIRASELHDLVARLPQGLQTSIGEGGALLSGGEGQRLRLARAWARSDARLVLFDEPLRGLTRAQRRTLLGRARAHWASSTLLCVTHDVVETAGFDRVLVIEGGRIVEDGAPAALMARAGSRYRALHEAHRTMFDGLLDRAEWRRITVGDGQISEAPAQPAEEA